MKAEIRSRCSDAVALDHSLLQRCSACSAPMKATAITLRSPTSPRTRRATHKQSNRSPPGGLNGLPLDYGGSGWLQLNRAAEDPPRNLDQSAAQQFH